MGADVDSPRRRSRRGRWLIDATLFGESASRVVRLRLPDATAAC